MSLTVDQQMIADAVVRHTGAPTKNKSIADRLLLITGNAGTGKSYLTSTIAHELAQLKLVKLTAPTHKAASVLREMIGFSEIDVSTIHSHLRLKVSDDTNTGIRKLLPDKSATSKRVDILIVDEFSMIDRELYEYIIAFLKRDLVKYVIFVGDHYQLPPVNDDFSVLQEVPREQQFMLTQVLRQAADNPVIQLSQHCVEHIKLGKTKQSLLSTIATFSAAQIHIHTDHIEFLEAFIVDPDDDAVILSYTNSAVDQNNLVARAFKKGEDIDDFIPTDRLIFQEMYEYGDTTYANNQEVEVVSAVRKHYSKYGVDFWELETSHGTVETVANSSLDQWKQTLQLMANEAVRERDDSARRQKWGMYFGAKKTFAETKFHYSSTIHKSQGSTYPRVYLDLTKMHYTEDNLFCRLAYVGITRTSGELHILLP
jgi:exodeoxyribonuclease-5